MDIDQSIVELQVTGIVERAGDRLRRPDEQRKRSSAFIALCVRAVLGLEEDEAVARLTDGGGDAGIDAIHLGDLMDGEITVTVFSGKYRRRTDGDFAYPANDIEKVANSVRALFDPSLPPFEGDERLKIRVEEVRSLVRDGVYPHVHVVLCSNGRTWDQNGQRHIDRLAGEQITWEHLDVDRLVRLLQPLRPVDDTLRLAGRAIDENLGLRVVVGRMAVAEVAALFDRHGDRLLEQNIRRYLGRNQVNRQIEETLCNPERRSNFYAFNNGITMVCSQLKFNALQAQDHVIPVKDLRVVNGGQTCWTIHRVVGSLPDEDWSLAQVLVRLYEVTDDDRHIVDALTLATNSQSPVEMVDLHSNDPIQLKLEQGLKGLGYTYLRKRGQRPNGLPTITPEQAAAAVLAVWRGKPHLARFSARQHFGRLYHEIFNEQLLPAHVVMACGLVEAVKVAVQKLKDYPWMEYGRFHLAYCMARRLFPMGPPSTAELALTEEKAAKLVNETGLRFVDLMIAKGVPRGSLQAQSAFFRRPDALDGIAVEDDPAP
jgi:hypothetical protein